MNSSVPAERHDIDQQIPDRTAKGAATSSRNRLVLFSVVGVALLAITNIALIVSRPRAYQFEIETIVSSETPGRYKHAPSACELPNGDILLVYCGGSGEYSDDPAIWEMRWNHVSETWGQPRILVDDPQKADANPVIWCDENNVVWLFYVVRHQATWSTATLQVMQSLDEGTTWLNVDLPFQDEPIMTRCRPIATPDGGFLLPVYYEAGTDPEFLPPDTASFFLRYDARKQSWAATNKVHSRLGNLQPSVARISDARSDYLVAYCRRGGGYLGKEQGFVVRSESTDGGRTWTEGVDSPFPNPNSAVDFVRLASGNLILAYNDNNTDRSPLSVAISTDGDRSYPYRREIISGGLLDFSYPCVLQDRNGTIHLFFSSDARSRINHVAFEERDIIADRSGKYLR